MFGGLKVIGEIKFDKWIDFNHKDTIYKLKFAWLKFGKSWTTFQAFLLPNIPAIRYLTMGGQVSIHKWLFSDAIEPQDAFLISSEGQ